MKKHFCNTITSTLTCVFIFFFTLHVNAQTFTEIANHTIPALSEGSLDWGDYNNDGFLDVLITGSSGAKIYKNNSGDGTFSLQSGSGLPTFTNGAASWGDYNNDGKLDILIAGTVGTTIMTKVYRNNGDNTFTDISGNQIRGVKDCSVAWGDYDNDGDPDILITGYDGSSNASNVYRNDGNNSFVELSNFSLPGLGYNGRGAWGDYDNDGYLDILLCGNGISELYHNEKNQTFTKKTSFTGISNGDGTFNDYDGDGYLDVILQGYAAGPKTLFYHNNGNGSFSPVSFANIYGLQYNTIRWSDYDNDGINDLLMAGDTYFTPSKKVTTIFKNNGNNTFTENTSLGFAGISHGDIAWGDYDNDRDLDLLVTGYTGSTYITKLYRNDCTTPNPAPESPTSTASVVSNRDITLKWKSVRTDNTPYKSISYNVGISTVKDSFNICNPNSEKTGFHTVARVGNVGLDTTCMFKNLVPGKYYWQVQAIDNSYIGSAFSAIDSFTVAAIQASLIQGIRIDNNSMKLKWTRGNGEKCIVFCKVTTTAPASPVNGKTYLADSEFGYGTQIGTTGWYCMYNGRGDSATISGLNPSYEYNFSVIEYNGNLGAEKYYTQTAPNNPKSLSTGLFSEVKTISLTGISNGKAIWSDYNNNGYLDILMTGASGIYPSWTPYTAIYANSGANSFTTSGISIKQMQYSSLSIGDYNNDNMLDLALNGSPGTNLKSTLIYKQYAGGFTEQTDVLLTGMRHGCVDWGDYDNDGDLDILSVGESSKVYRNDGNNLFAEPNGINLPSITNGTCSWGDYNNDGYLDILLCGLNGSTKIVKVYKNNKNGTFSDSNIALPGIDNGFAEWIDYNNDGNIDIILGGKNASNTATIYVYKNNGNESFSAQSNMGLAASSEGSISAGDYDNDGYLDLFITGFYTAKLYHNNSGVNFSEITGIIPLGVLNGTSTWGDFDNDGDLDILYAGYYSDFKSYTKILRNNHFSNKDTYPTNSSPTAPTNLSAALLPHKTQLSWDASTDNETPSNALTYNLRLKKEDATDWCYYPQADNSGFRKVSKNGNMQFNKSLLIKDLPRGKYYWSVQAIDQGYKGGSWSTENSFVIKTTQAFFNFDTVCHGYATKLTDLSTSSVGIASKQWFYHNAVISSDSIAPFIFPTAGVDSIKLVVTDIDGVKDSVTHKIKINPRPIAAFTAPAVCVGNGTTYTNTTVVPSGLSVTWQWDFGDGTPNSKPIVEGPIDYTYLKAGIFNASLIVAADNGCSDTALHTVTVTPVPIANIAISSGSKFSFCKNSGDSAYLSVPVQANCIYQWKNNGVDILGATSENLTIKENGGIFTVTVTNTIGGCSATSSTPVVIEVKESPAKPAITYNSSATTFCQGDSLMLQVAAESGVSFQWKLNGGLVGSNATYAAKQSGNYTLTILNTSTNCPANANDTVKVTVNSRPELPLLNFGKTTVCNGEMVAFSVPMNTNYTYQWRKGAESISNATSNSFTAYESGEYSLRMTNSSQCWRQTEPVTVTINPAPSTPIIEQPTATTLCSGDSVLFKASPISEVTYEWLLNGGITGNNSNQLYANASGTYALRVRNAFQCEATSAALQLTVNPRPEMPSVSYGETTICNGNHVAFSLPLNPNYTYQWRRNAENISNATSNSFTAYESGDYSLIVTNSNNQCWRQTPPVTVTVNEKPSKPTIAEKNNTTQFCLGTEVDLHVTNENTLLYYKWKRWGEPVGGATNATLKGKLIGGDYTVEAILGDCTTESDVLSLTTKPAPAKPTIYAKGPNVWLLACDNTTAKDYRWYYNDQMILGAKSNQYVANKNLGNYHVEISDGGECYTASDVINIPTGDIVNGISNLTADVITIHPNPTESIVNINVGNILVGMLTVEIMDTFGRTVAVYQHTDSMGFTVDLGGLPNGIYFCKMSHQNRFVIKKIVKQ